jgi:hypothetical protein
MLNENSDAELLQSGYTEEDIDTIRNHEALLIERVEELAELDEETLSNMGYSPEQIDIINNFDGIDTQLQALGGTLSFTLDADSMYYTSSTNKAHARLTVTFEWITQPLIKFTDIIGIAWNGPMNRTAQTASVQYVHMSSGGSSYYDYNAQVVNPSGPVNAGVGFKFPMRGSGANFDTHYAKSGTFIVVLEVTGHVSSFAAYAEYGHATISISGGPTFSAPGGISIDFSPSGSITESGTDWTPTYYI